MNIEVFCSELEKLGIILNGEQLKQLELFYELLIEWNEKINLTGITVKEDVYLKHFYDSLTLYRDIDLNKNVSICDVGTGAGFPGIVLKIVFPNLKITLIDSLNKIPSLVFSFNPHTLIIIISVKINVPKPMSNRLIILKIENIKCFTPFLIVN